MQTNSISLIIPCYNEETNIQKGVLDKVGNFVHEKKQFKEVLIVDDGSTDDTRKIIKERYLSLIPKLRLIENKHYGKAASIIAGIEKASGDYTMFMDFDLATPLEETEKLIQAVNNGYEIVIGSRNKNRRGAPLLRRLQSVGWIAVRSFFIGLKGIKDTQCGFKMFKRSAATDIIAHLRVFNHKHTVHGSSVSAGFDLEFLFLAKKLGYKIEEVPVEWRHVETKNVSFIKSSLESLEDLYRIKVMDLKGMYN